MATEPPPDRIEPGSPPETPPETVPELEPIPPEIEPPPPNIDRPGRGPDELPPDQV